jgi:DNA-binding MarR family transcriptional regulator
MPVDAVVARMLGGLHDAGFTDIVPAHLNVLRYPGPQGRRPSELAAETRMTKQAVNYLLRQLEHLGYLTRTGDDRDQRSKRIQLTGRGLAAAENIRATVRQIEVELEHELGRARFGQLRSLLEDLNGTTLVRERQATPSERR